MPNNQQPSDNVEGPWTKDWGIPQQEATESPVAASEPWNRDWGITDYINGAVEAVKAIPGAVKSYSLKAVAANMWQAESGNRHTDSSGKLITSSKGAKGITQVMSATGKKPGFGVKPLQDNSKEEYLRFGTDYVAAMLDKYNGDFRMAVAAYNAGPGNVDKAVQQASEKGGDFTQYLPKPEETIPYLDKVLGTKNGVLNG